MLYTKQEMLARLAELGIDQRTTTHAPVFTVEEAQLHTHDLPGGHCKNLFLSRTRRIASGSSPASTSSGST